MRFLKLISVVIVISLSLLSQFSFAVIDKNTKQILLEMSKSDQEIRKSIIAFENNKVPQEILNKVTKIDTKNTLQLKSIVAVNGWPTKDQVGVDGVGAAFLIIQHSADRNFQQAMLANLKKSYINNEGVSGQQLALLSDRVMLAKGEKQIYGTQFDIKNNQVVFKPIENENIIDELRKEMKLPPLAFYKKLMEEVYGIKDHPDIEL